ncbi:MAG TPA: hypothetical protein VHN74_21395 [Candidatus Angelobacter sp.]|nr:hypothetical protein [Candidatus Angelobacter sp.]
MKCFLIPAVKVCKTKTILRAVPFLAIALLIACAGRETPASNTLDVAITGQTITKARTAGNQIVLLEERLTSIFEDGPQRTLAVVQSDGHVMHPYAAPTGWSVVDFAVHPSGDISAVLTTAREVRIVRLDQNGSIRSDQPFADPAAVTDPYFDYAGGIKDDSALQPALMHDAARLVPMGESLGVVLRTGRNAIVAYRLDPDVSGAYQRSWRTLVEPGSSILLEGITSGSFDVFGQLQNHVMVFADVDASGTLAVGVVNSPNRNFTFRAHTDFFGEPIAASMGVLLTRVAGADGQRLGSTAVDTQQLAELHTVRATPHGFVLAGRVLTEVRPDGTGWNAFAAQIGSDGTAGPYSVIDVDRGDVLFDVAALPSGRYLALGTTGYVQNPTGASISEAAQPMLVLLNADGTLAQNIGFSGGARHNQLTTIVSLNGRWLLGGMMNGPGTHSGDNQRELIVADGFLREQDNLPAE